MSAIPKGSGARELTPEGVHNANCVQVIDLGTQTVTFKGEERQSRQVQLAFELADEKTSEGNAFVSYRKYTYSSSPKSNLMKDLRAWLGKDKVTGDFEMDTLLGKPAMITIEHSETERGTFANITNIGGLAKGMKPKKPTEPLRSLYLDESFDSATFEELPEFLKEKIMVTKEYEEFGADAKPAKKVAAKKGVKK